eukprot:scaffold2732_cov120-Skeletonema_dohrnii-CCMP3373.AAC.1
MVETEDSEASFGLNLNFSSSSNAKRNFSSTKSNIEAIEENISMQFPLRRENKSGGNNSSSVGKEIFVNRRGDSSSSFLKDCTANFLQRVRSKDEGDETADGGGRLCKSSIRPRKKEGDEGGTNKQPSRHDVSTKLKFPSNDYSNQIIAISFLHSQ